MSNFRAIFEKYLREIVNPTLNNKSNVPQNITLKTSQEKSCVSENIFVHNAGLRIKLLSREPNCIFYFSYCIF